MEMLFSTGKNLFSANQKNTFSSWFDKYLGTHGSPDLIKEDEYESEYYEEWAQYLLKKNLEDIKTTNRMKHRYTFYSPKLVASVFNLCKMLNQPPDVRYLAIDILDRFLIGHFFAVVKSFQMMENANESGWKVIIDRLPNQSLLRILTCIQIAAKQCSSRSLITVKTVEDIMRYLKHSQVYPKRSIIKSEARIYQTLNFSISNRTPLIYVELFLEDLKKTQYFQRKQKSMHELFIICISILDVATIHHRQIYTDLLTHFKFDCVSDQQNVIQELKGDYLTLGAAVVYSAFELNGAKSFFVNYLFNEAESFHFEHQNKLTIVQLGKEILQIIFRK